MSAPTASAGARRLDQPGIERLTGLLESGFDGRSDPMAHQHLLDALDRHEHVRFLVWPPADPVGVLYIGASGAVMAAGDPEAATAFAGPAEHADWRVLLGDAVPCQALLDASSKGFFRRRHSAREQRFMATTAPLGSPHLPGLRRAEPAELERLTDFACRLHVEDRMGPQISRAGRAAVRARMHDSITAGATWVLERDGLSVAKIDLSLSSPRRGAQLAGVYVEEPWRGLGLGSAAIAAVTAELLTQGLPCVTLHVRADNGAAIAAYRRAGFADRGPWLLALR
ncbi:MAG: GNAT family N-acetyltransferase [Egibacteraceae bacterium]